jgi:hypothetical protein
MNKTNNEPVDKPLLNLADLSEAMQTEDFSPSKKKARTKFIFPAGALQIALALIVKQKLKPLELERKLKDLKELSGYPMGALRSAYKDCELAQSNDQSSDDIDPESFFTDQEKLAAEKLSNKTNLFKEFPMTMDCLDYVTTKPRAQCMLAVLGLTLIRKVVYVCFYGETSDGKTEAMEKLLNLIDFGGSLGVVRKRLETSNQWLKYAGGDDGTGLTNKILFFDEVNPVKRGEDDTKQSMMRQFDSDNSDYAEYAIVDKDAKGRNNERVLRLKKPTQFFMTSITAPHNWDAQNRNRYIFLEFSHNHESVFQVLDRIADPISNKESQTLIYKSWNYFLLKYAGRLDPNDSAAFYDVEVPFLKELNTNSGTGVSSDIRRFKLIKKFIQASALLHARHRTADVTLLAERF